jgi:hypothetical protein
MLQYQITMRLSLFRIENLAQDCYDLDLGDYGIFVSALGDKVEKNQQFIMICGGADEI